MVPLSGKCQTGLILALGSFAAASCTHICVMEGLSFQLSNSLLCHGTGAPRAVSCLHLPSKTTETLLPVPPKPALKVIWNSPAPTHLPTVDFCVCPLPAAGNTRCSFCLGNVFCTEDTPFSPLSCHKIPFPLLLLREGISLFFFCDFISKLMTPLLNTLSASGEEGVSGP